MTDNEAYLSILAGISKNELIVFGTCCLAVCVSLFLPIDRFERLKLGFLITGVSCLSILAASHLDVLLLWDEQYHALVASNFAQNPFYPLLIDQQGYPYLKEVWINNQVWLHKQPLSLWQIALSIKLLGNTVFAVRLPSVILHCMSTLLVYAIGKRLGDKNPAFIAATLFGTSGYLIAFVSGAEGMDHVDTAFTFYILASIYTLFRYQESPTFKRAAMVGLLVGLAVLTKWLVGLIALGVWGIVLILWHRKQWSKWKHYGLGWIVALVTFLPWQIYCFIRFPEEFTHEMAFNSKHFFEVVEGHGGNWNYYWDQLSVYLNVNSGLSWLLLVLFVYFVIWTIQNKSPFHFSILLSFTLVVIFFSLAQTKLYGYVNIVLGFCYLIMAFSISGVLKRIFHRFRLNLVVKSSLPLLLLPVLYFNINARFTAERYDFKYPEVFVNRRSQIKQISHLLHKHGKGYTYLIKNDQTTLLPQLLFDNPGYHVLYYFDNVPYKNPYYIDVSNLH